MQDNRSAIDSQNNDVIEVDLRDIWRELVQAKKLIIGATVGMAAAAAIYSFAIAKPVYQYDTMIELPADANGTQINTSVELLKSDGVNAVNVKNTALLKLTFEGNDPVKIKADADSYTDKATERLNKNLLEVQQQRFQREVIENIQRDISYITTRVNENSFAKEDAAQSLAFLKSKIETKEANKVFLKAKALDKKEAPTIPASPKKAKNIGVAAVLGLLFSCMYVIGKFLWRL